MSVLIDGHRPTECSRFKVAFAIDLKPRRGNCPRSFSRGYASIGWEISNVSLCCFHLDALCVYATDGRLPINNNQVERLLKRVAIGRKNWLFVGSMRAGIRNASLMSLVASAQRQEIDIGMYLESVITHLLRGTARVEELLPDRWKVDHPESCAHLSGAGASR